MNEFDNIKSNMKLAIMLDPTISLKIQHDYLDLLEVCKSMAEVPNQLEKYAKIILTEMKEEQEELEEFKNENKNLNSIDSVVSSLSNAIAQLDNKENINIGDSVNNSNELFDYIDKDGKIKIKSNNISKKVKKYDWKRELRRKLRNLILTLNDDNFCNKYIKDKNSNDILEYKSDLKELHNIFEKYNLYEKNIFEKESIIKDYLNSRLLDLNEAQLMSCLEYLLLKQDTEITENYANNGVLRGLVTLLYNHLYNLI